MLDWVDHGVITAEEALSRMVFVAMHDLPADWLEAPPRVAAEWLPAAGRRRVKREFRSLAALIDVGVSPAQFKEFSDADISWQGMIAAAQAGWDAAQTSAAVSALSRKIRSVLTFGFADGLFWSEDDGPTSGQVTLHPTVQLVSSCDISVRAQLRCTNRGVRRALHHPSYDAVRHNQQNGLDPPSSGWQHKHLGQQLDGSVEIAISPEQIEPFWEAQQIPGVLVVRLHSDSIADALTWTPTPAGFDGRVSRITADPNGGWSCREGHLMPFIVRVIGTGPERVQPISTHGSVGS
jgi:hypothetical protein